MIKNIYILVLSQELVYYRIAKAFLLHSVVLSIFKVYALYLNISRLHKKALFCS